MAVNLDAMAPRLQLWRHEPDAMVRELFGVEPYPWQVKVLRAFADPAPTARARHIAVQSCAGPGKTAAEAWCGWNFLLCYGHTGEHPKGAATSITQPNLRDNLWAEFSKWQQRSDLLLSLFEWQTTRIESREHPQTWFLSARPWSKSADPETLGRTLSGLHSQYVLALIDESGGIPISILKAAEQALGRTDLRFGKILQCGNPIDHKGMLYAAAEEQAGSWTVERLTGDPDDPNRVEQIDIEWAREEIKKWGRDNPWVMAHILGRFPPSSINSLLSPDQVRDAIARHLEEDEYEWAQKRIGIDVARFGDDRTVFFPRQGRAAFMPEIMRHPIDSSVSVEIASRIAYMKDHWGSDQEFLDDTVGWAHGAVDVLRHNGFSPVAVQFDKPGAHPKYKNRRAEMWFRMADWVKGGGCLPDVEGIVKELTEPTYSFMGGKFIIEDKAQIKKRLGYSCDLADALALTFALPDLPKGARLRHGRRGGKTNMTSFEYDPLDPSRQ